MIIILSQEIVAWIWMYLAMMGVSTVVALIISYAGTDTAPLWTFKGTAMAIKCILFWPVILFLVWTYGLFVIAQFLMKILINPLWTIHVKVFPDYDR